MRGKVSVRKKLIVQAWITPAHAGKRYIYGEIKDVLEDHPRPCGEKPSQ